MMTIEANMEEKEKQLEDMVAISNITMDYKIEAEYIRGLATLTKITTNEKIDNDLYWLENTNLILPDCIERIGDHVLDYIIAEGVVFDFREIKYIGKNNIYNCCYERGNTFILNSEIEEFRFNTTEDYFGTHNMNNYHYRLLWTDDLDMDKNKDLDNMTLEFKGHDVVINGHDWGFAGIPLSLTGRLQPKLKSGYKRLIIHDNVKMNNIFNVPELIIGDDAWIGGRMPNHVDLIKCSESMFDLVLSLWNVSKLSESGSLVDNLQSLENLISAYELGTNNTYNRKQLDYKNMVDSLWISELYFGLPCEYDGRIVETDIKLSDIKCLVSDGQSFEEALNCCIMNKWKAMCEKYHFSVALDDYIRKRDWVMELKNDNLGKFAIEDLKGLVLQKV